MCRNPQAAGPERVQSVVVRPLRMVGGLGRLHGIQRLSIDTLLAALSDVQRVDHPRLAGDGLAVGVRLVRERAYDDGVRLQAEVEQRRIRDAARRGNHRRIVGIPWRWPSRPPGAAGSTPSPPTAAEPPSAQSPDRVSPSPPARSMPAISHHLAPGGFSRIRGFRNATDLSRPSSTSKYSLSISSEMTWS